MHVLLKTVSAASALLLLVACVQVGGSRGDPEAGRLAGLFRDTSPTDAANKVAGLCASNRIAVTVHTSSRVECAKIAPNPAALPRSVTRNAGPGAPVEILQFNIAEDARGSAVLLNAFVEIVTLEGQVVRRPLLSDEDFQSIASILQQLGAEPVA